MTDASLFWAVQTSKVANLIARWTGRIQSEDVEVASTPVMWVILKGYERYDGKPSFEIYADTEFDYLNDYGMNILVDGESYSIYTRIYADEGRHKFSGLGDVEQGKVERVSVQTREGNDLRCTKDEEQSTTAETVFSCVWRN